MVCLSKIKLNMAGNFNKKGTRQKIQFALMDSKTGKPRIQSDKRYFSKQIMVGKRGDVGKRKKALRKGEGVGEYIYFQLKVNMPGLEHRVEIMVEIWCVQINTSSQHNQFSPSPYILHVQLYTSLVQLFIFTPFMYSFPYSTCTIVQFSRVHLMTNFTKWLPLLNYLVQEKVVFMFQNLLFNASSYMLSRANVSVFKY